MTSPPLDQKALAAAKAAGDLLGVHDSLIEDIVEAYLASLPAPEPVARDDHRFAVVSSDYARPFLAGAYPTLENAVKAQCGSPDKWHIFERYHASPPSHQGLREAAQALVDKLELMENDERYKSIWATAYVHGNSYRGPNYAPEFVALRAALQSQPAPSRETK